MAFGSYTLYDLIASFYLVFLFIPLAIIPGYLASWVTNIFDFRTQTVWWRVLLSIPISIGIVPISIYWLGRFLPWSGTSAIFALATVAWMVLVAGFGGHEKPSKWLRSLLHTPKFVWICAAIWFLVAIGSLVDLQLGNKLYFSVIGWDYAVRTAITDAISRQGVQPTNPFYGLTPSPPLRYHYFWFLPCSLAAQWSRLPDAARPAMNASVVWCGWGLMALLAIYLRFIQQVRGEAFTRRVKLGLALFLVTGLDLLPVASGFRHGVVRGDLEWWNGAGQITSWVNTVLWVPHNAAALIAGLSGFAVLWPDKPLLTRRDQILRGLLCGVILGSMLGDSVYVGIAFAAFFLSWTIYALVTKRRSLLLPLVLAGVTTTALAAPYLVRLSGGSGGTAFIRLGVRQFSPLLGIATAYHLEGLRANLLYLVALPVQYLLELGFFLLVPLVYAPVIRQNRKQLWMAAFALMALIPFLIATFFRSGVVGTNDLGWRAFLPVQFILLLWATDLIASWRETSGSWFRVPLSWRLQLALGFTVALGLCGTFYGLFIVRAYPLLADAGILKPLFVEQSHIGEFTYGLRQGYEALNRKLPEGSVIQTNPHWLIYDFFLGLYSHHPTAAFNMTCGVELGGEASACKHEYPLLENIFVRPDTDRAADVCNLANKWHTKAVIVYKTDPAWTQGGWTKEMTPAVETNSMRAYILPDSPKSLQATRAFVSQTAPARTYSVRR